MGLPIGGDDQTADRGEPGDLSDFDEMLVITDEDIQEAVEWWDDNAPPAWQGALEE